MPRISTEENSINEKQLRPTIVTRPSVISLCLLILLIG